LTTVTLVKQHKPLEGYKFALDFAHTETKVGIEIQGGIWYADSRGHGGGKQLLVDYTKSNLLQIQGWIVFQLADTMISKQEWLLQILWAIEARQGRDIEQLFTPIKGLSPFTKPKKPKKL
jgi:very-short-patch-repair endonuclease